MKEDFVDFLYKLLSRGLNEEYVEYILKNSKRSAEYLRQFSEAFTDASVSQKYNYEIAEHVGDATLKHITVKYIDNRWAMDNLSVQVRSALSQKLYAKNNLARMARELGFEKFITADRIINIDMLEDTFEAFLGVAERVIDDIWGMGSGFKCLYNVVASIWDTEDIDTSENAVKGYKSRLKENIWDPLGWRTNYMTNTQLTFKQLSAIQDMYWNTRTKQWISHEEGLTTPDAIKYYLAFIFNPDGAMISWAADRNEKDAKEKAAEIAFKVFENTGVLDFANNREKGIRETYIPTDQLPSAYQKFVYERVAHRLTYTSLVTQYQLIAHLMNKFNGDKSDINVKINSQDMDRK